jgi:hypothetical protein
VSEETSVMAKLGEMQRRAGRIEGVTHSDGGIHVGLICEGAAGKDALRHRALGGHIGIRAQ